MKVKELINILNQYEGDREIYIGENMELYELAVQELWDSEPQENYYIIVRDIV